MNVKQRHIMQFLVTAFAVTLLLSCDGKADDIRKMNIKSDAPASEGRGIDLKYTDSGRVTAHMKTPYLKNFTNAAYPYEEFPEGVEVTIFEKDGKRNIITSDYAIRFTDSKLVDLQKNVTLLTNDSITLNAEQLYWDPSTNWIFTDKPYTILMKDGSRNDGDLFDSNQEFTNFVSLNNVSKQYIKENPEDL